MKKLIGIIVLLAIVFGSNLVIAETKVGLDWSYGKDYMLPDFLTSRECDNTVNRFSFRVETNEIISSWESVFLGIETRYSMHKADETKEGSYGLGHDGHFRELGFNITAKKVWGWFHAGVFAGLSYPLSISNKMHQLKTDTWLLGTWGPMVGLNIPISNSWELRLEARGAHTSGPFDRDKGKNWGEGTIGVTYSFDNAKSLFKAIGFGE